MYFDQNITVRLVNARENKLKKGYLSLPADLASCWQEFRILQAGISNGQKTPLSLALALALALALSFSLFSLFLHFSSFLMTLSADQNRFLP